MIVKSNLTELREAIEAGDKDIFFKCLYTSYATYGIKAIRSFDLKPLSAQDVIQEVFADWQKKDLDFFKPETLRALLCVACYNKAKDMLKRRKGWDSQVEFSELLSDAQDHSFTSILFQDTRLYYLRILKPEYRDVFMDYLDGYKLREIAARRKMSLSTAKSYKLKAQHFLRSFLSKND